MVRSGDCSGSRPPNCPMVVNPIAKVDAKYVNAPICHHLFFLFNAFPSVLKGCLQKTVPISSLLKVARLPLCHPIVYAANLCMAAADVAEGRVKCHCSCPILCLFCSVFAVLPTCQPLDSLVEIAFQHTHLSFPVDFKLPFCFFDGLLMRYCAIALQDVLAQS